MIHFSRGAFAVEVSADSLYEAAAMAIVEFRREGLLEATIGPGTELRVVSFPAATRQYSLKWAGWRMGQARHMPRPKAKGSSRPNRSDVGANDLALKQPSGSFQHF